MSGNKSISAESSLSISLIKLFSILLVVFMHATNSHTFVNGVPVGSGSSLEIYIESFISYRMGRTAVPAFFLLSGYLFFVNFKTRHNLTEMFMGKFKTRLYSLFVPYVLWSLISFVLIFIAQLPSFAQKYFSYKLIKHYDFWEFLNKLILHPFAEQLWFLRFLMVFVMISPVIYYLVRYLGTYLLLFLTVLYLFQTYPTYYFPFYSFFVGAYLGISNCPINRWNDYFNKMRLSSLILLTALWFLLLILSMEMGHGFPSSMRKCTTKREGMLGGYVQKV